MKYTSESFLRINENINLTVKSTYNSTTNDQDEKIYINSKFIAHLSDKVMSVVVRDEADAEYLCKIGNIPYSFQGENSTMHFYLSESNNNDLLKLINSVRKEAFEASNVNWE